MEKHATVSCESTVPIWQWPLAVQTAMEVATVLHERLYGGISVLFREQDGAQLPTQAKPPRFFYADLAWRNRVFASICCSPFKKEAVSVVDAANNTTVCHPDSRPGTDASIGRYSSAEDVLFLVSDCLCRKSEAEQLNAEGKLNTARHVLACLK